MSPARGRAPSTHRRCAGPVVATALGLAACGPTIVGDPVGGPREAQDAQAQPRAAEGEPAGFEVDPAVTLHDVVFSALAAEERVWLVSLRVRNDDGVSREIVLPDNYDPRHERTDRGLRLTWLRTAVASSDPETGAVTFDRRRSSTETVAVFRRQELVVDDLRITQLNFEPDDEFEVCLEAIEPLHPDSPSAWTRTGVELTTRAGYEDGETVLLACGSATRGPDVEFLEDLTTEELP